MNIKTIDKNSIRLSADKQSVEIVGLSELADARFHSIGEDMVIARRGKHEFFIINTDTGRMRQFVDSNERLLVDDSEVNHQQILSRISNGHHYLNNRIATFGGLYAWDGFKNGYCALDWTIYPEGRYFADEGGFGMEDNEEQVAYCVIDKNLAIVVPFFYDDNPKEILMAVRNGTHTGACRVQA